jgi:uncharacterized protein YndB with AHSA1/START domain
MTTTLTVPTGSHEIVMTREFDAPRELIFKAYTDPELMKRWWGPRKYETTIEEMDVRFGGVWRITHRDGDTAHGFRGVYHDVTPNERLVTTFEYVGAPGHIALDTLQLDDLGGGRTRLTSRSVFQTIEDRDGMVASGMESGARESLDRLSELLAEQLAKRS